MELRDYLNVIRARRWVIIQAMVIVTLTALVVSYIQPPVYSGEAKVLISEKDSSAALFGSVLPEISSQPERGLQTQVQLMQLRPLAEETIRLLGLETTPNELLGRVSVVGVGQTNVVRVTARAGTPKMAAAIANQMAAGYVAWSQDSKRESLRSASQEVEARLEDAKDQILELGRRIQSEGKSDELSAELQIATGTYTTLAEKLEQLKINEELETGSGRVVSVAVADALPVAPTPLRNAILGLAVGLALGLGMAFLYEYMDNTMKTTEETERIVGAPVLGTIPLEKYEKGVKRRLSVIEAPSSPAAESYRVLRNSLDFINFEHEMKTLIVTSAAPAEGKSTVAANLAASLSQAGKKVVLLSSDFRRPTTESFFGVTNLIGLSDVLLGTHSLKSALQRPGDESLLVLTSGKMPPNPAELLSSTKMQSLVDELEEWADWVIIDTPPLLAVADPASVARWADGVLMVSQAGRSTRDASRKAVELLGKVGARIIGVVIWGLQEGKDGQGYGYYAGGYYYYASYYSGTEQAKGKGKKPKAAKGKSGADDDYAWVPEISAGRRIARVVGRVFAGLLAFLLMVAIALVVVYFLDGYFAWGVVDSLFGLL